MAFLVTTSNPVRTRLEKKVLEKVLESQVGRFGQELLSQRKYLYNRANVSLEDYLGLGLPLQKYKK